jgi:hypothetical protein
MTSLKAARLPPFVKYKSVPNQGPIVLSPFGTSDPLRDCFQDIGDPYAAALK